MIQAQELLEPFSDRIDVLKLIRVEYLRKAAICAELIQVMRFQAEKIYSIILHSVEFFPARAALVRFF